VTFAQPEGQGKSKQFEESLRLDEVSFKDLSKQQWDIRFIVEYIFLSRFAPLLQKSSYDDFHDEQRLPIAALYYSDPCIRPSIRALIFLKKNGGKGSRWNNLGALISFSSEE
jgi:hypothetical protein